MSMRRFVVMCGLGDILRMAWSLTAAGGLHSSQDGG